MNPLDEQVLRHACTNSFETFVRYAFKAQYGVNFRMQDFHLQIIHTLEKVYKAELPPRLIINIPPRHGKTEIVKLFLAWVMAKKPNAKNIVLSYSEGLSSEIAEHSRNYLMNPRVNSLFGTQLKADNKSKSHWVTENGGEVYSSPTAGQVTGKGAGIIGSTGGEGGVLIMDDPLKSADALYDSKRNHVNALYWEVVKSRLNGQQTPMIIIMQRLHEDDLTGHLMFEQPDVWHHLKIPVYREDGEVLWTDVYDKPEAIKDAKSRPQWFAGQMLQEPAPLEGGIWKQDWYDIVRPEEVPDGIKWELFVDGAYTKDTKNDPTGLMVAGKHQDYVDGKPVKTLYIKHNEGKYMEMPELIRHTSSLCGLHNVKMVLAEPKASGKTYIQLIKSSTSIPAKEIKSRWVNKSKIEKAHDIAPFIEGGRIKLIKGEWNTAYLNQVSVFPNGRHDEDVDNTAYAGERNLLRKEAKVY